jgi:cytochrome P450
MQTLAYTLWPLHLFTQAHKRYGEPFTIRLSGLGDFVIVTSPQLIKQVFTGDPAELQAGKANAMLEPLVGRKSLLLLDGKEHLRQRRLLLPPLHGERMQAYARIMESLTLDGLARMPLYTPFSVHSHMQSITLRVILRAVFGMHEGPEMDELSRMLVEFMEPPPDLMIFLPPKLLPHLDFPGSPWRTFVRRRARVHERLTEIIRARRASPDPSRTDVLTLLLAAQDEEGRPMTEEELRDELVTLLVAGHETTATALSWAIALILAAPAVESRLRKELESVRAADGLLDLTALGSCEYLDALIKETMRLRPVLIDVVRRVERPMEVGGYEIPVGAYLTPAIYLAHRRPESWPDPERFLPERFIGAKVDPYSFLPFGGGIRRCIGMAFALYEMKVVLATLFLRARPRLASQRPIKTVRRTITLAPANGTPIILDARS